MTPVSPPGLFSSPLFTNGSGCERMPRNTLDAVNKVVYKISALGSIYVVNVYIYIGKREGLLRCLGVWFEFSKPAWCLGNSRSRIVWWYGVFHTRHEFWFRKLPRMNFGIRNHWQTAYLCVSHRNTSELLDTFPSVFPGLVVAGGPWEGWAEGFLSVFSCGDLFFSKRCISLTWMPVCLWFLFNNYSVDFDVIGWPYAFSNSFLYLCQGTLLKHLF